MPPSATFDWKRVAKLVLLSRAIDTIEEEELYPQKKIAYQFSARGHALSQVLLGSLLTQKNDGLGTYYRSRPLLLALGLTAAESFAGPLGKVGSFSNGRDIGVVCNMPSRGAANVLPMAGDVGSQFTPASGWAEALVYKEKQLGCAACSSAIAVAHAGEGAVATNGFWSALNIATTRSLPMLFFIEDNAWAISVPSTAQFPGGDFVRNLQSYQNMTFLSGDGTDPEDASTKIESAMNLVRNERQVVLLRLRVPRLGGHSAQDSQLYKGDALLAKEQRRDPVPKLENYLVPDVFSADEWRVLEDEVNQMAQDALDEALTLPDPVPENTQRYVFFEGEPSQLGGLCDAKAPTTTKAHPEGPRINLLDAVRRTLSVELEVNETALVFGEDVGVKGGVHAATLGLQERFGIHRVFDTSLSEEGIVGRAVGMALAGLRPIPEIQFRKYMDAGTEQLNNCGTIRWRTVNRCAAPVVVRTPVGYSRRAGDPWHSVSAEAVWAHQCGWRVLMPSNAEDAVGLLRTALRGNDPVLFFEHRALLDAPRARRPYPGDTFSLPLGQAKVVQEGSALTVVTWGAMLYHCLEAVAGFADKVELIDLRTIVPLDIETVFASVRKTKRLAVVHEDAMPLGVGAEIVSQVTKTLFFELDAPPLRIAPPLIPIPYHATLMDAVLPGVERIAAELEALLAF